MIKAAGDEDLALLNACLEVEAELRQQGYVAVERLLATVAVRNGRLSERVTPSPTGMLPARCATCTRLGGDTAHRCACKTSAAD